MTCIYCFFWMPHASVGKASIVKPPSPIFELWLECFAYLKY